jgi:large subunit ribosomal protein L5
MATKAKGTTQPAGRPAAPRLLERYRREIAPSLAKEFGYRNLMAVPRLEKIVVNMGCGEASHEAKVLEQAQRDLARITGQRPAMTRSRKAISNFRIKEGDPVGCRVTLRRRRMYEFLDRLVSAALPRIRDFRGLSPKGFDRGGNYSFGIVEQAIFPEVELDRVQFTLGMDVTVVTTAPDAPQAMSLLKAFGMPFRV